MGQQHEQEHERLGRAAKLKGASITVNTVSGDRKGAFKVSIGPLVPRGSTVLGTCTVHMHSGKNHGSGHSSDAKGYLEYDPMTGHLDIDAKGSGFKVNFILGNFNLTSEAGNGTWGENHAEMGQKEFSGPQGLTWRVNNWGREHAHDESCNQIPIF